MRKADLDRAGARKTLAADEQFHGMMGAELGHADHRDDRRDHADANFRKTVGRVLGSDHDVGRAHQTQPAGEGRAIDRNDHRLGAVDHALEHLGQRHCAPAVRRVTRRVLEVGAGAKSRTIAGQHDGAHRRIVDGGGQMIVKLIDQRGRQRIAVGRAVEGDPGSALLNRIEGRRRCCLGRCAARSVCACHAISPCCLRASRAPRHWRPALPR